MITVVPVELSDAALAADVADGLALVEEGLREAASARSTSCSTETSALPDRRRRQAVPRDAGPARRPVRRPQDERVVPAAVAIELTHLATLYHDDVMDEAAVRRGTPSANSRWDNTVAILTGDLPVRPRLADPGRPRPRGGQDPGRDLLPAGHRPDRRDRRPAARPGPARALHGRGHEKTASLIATSGQFGALFSGAPAERRRAGSRRPARRSASPSSSPTTFSTSPASRPSRARRQEPTCGRASGPCRCCTRCGRPGPATRGWSSC